jgi:hypothetical protein
LLLSGSGSRKVSSNLPKGQKVWNRMTARYETKVELIFARRKGSGAQYLP